MRLAGEPCSLNFIRFEPCLSGRERLRLCPELRDGTGHSVKTGIYFASPGRDL